MAKRCFDIVLSMLGLILSAPISGLIAIGIRLQDGGPVFFVQSRQGKNGCVFKAYKFRSMKVGDGSEEYQALENDPRITPFGRFLRSTALDEIPQLWNILKGDMSFVGPRPLMPSEVQVHSSRYSDSFIQSLFNKRSEVLPGLTGIAQIYAPRDISKVKKFRYDLLYIRKRNFFLDMKLILLSFLITFTGKWESRKSKLNIKKQRAMHV